MALCTILNYQRSFLSIYGDARRHGNSAFPHLRKLGLLGEALGQD